MQHDISQLEELLQQCTVKLSVAGQAGWGTGFFVAPEWILTCAHVVQEANGQPVQVGWQKRELEAAVEKSLPDYDLALLRVMLPTDANPPCVYLDAVVQSRDPLYLFGYPDQDFPNGCPVTFSCEGLTGDEPALIKFALGQVRPGMSGSPLLNQRTGKVCGIVKFTRDRSFDLGGGAVSTATILAQFPELQSKNHQFHQQDVTWSALLPKPVLTERRDRQDYRNRQILLNGVRNAWIKGVLENSLYSKAQIELGLEERFDVLELAYETPETFTQRLAKGTKIIDQFDELGAGRSLLILGAPGSGKTTTLLELARDLITRAEQDVNLPIPVVFNLSSWTNPKQKIQNWLVRELSTKYRVSRALGRTWIREQQLLLLLDGLDEVREDLRGICIQAINRFCREFGQTEVVVCSRLRDYENLRERFQFQEAITLQPLTQEQVDDYLNRAGEKLAGVKIAWQTDPVMQELAQTPLMLSVMALAYQGVSAEELPQTSLEERQNHLWDKYIDRMFERRRGNNRYYPKDKMLVWLIFLARKMTQESQTLFHIESIQPSWLHPGIKQWLYRGLVGLTAGLMVELGLGLPIGLMAGSLSSGVIYGCLTGATVGLSGGLNREIKLFETHRFSWSWLEVGKPTVVGLVFGGILGLGFGLFGPRIGLPVQGPTTGLLFGMVTGGFAAFIGRVLIGLVSPDIKKTTRLNQGVWLSVINSFIYTFIAFCLIVLPTIFFLTTPIRPPLSALVGTIGLMAGGLACIQHLILRIILWWNGNAPWNYAHFLIHAEQKTFLQQVGGSHKFVHGLLQKKLEKADLKSFQIPSTWRTSLIKICLTISLISLFIIGIFLPLAVDTGRVRSELAVSLAPRLREGDRLIIDKTFYYFNNPELGDIIMYKPTRNWQRRAFDLKFIAGLPGQEIRFFNEKVYVNHQAVSKNDLDLPEDFFKLKKIPEGFYLVVANSLNSNSNKLGGLVQKSNFVGKVVFCYWPPNRISRIY